MTVPSTVALLDNMAFGGCGDLSEVQLREGMHIICQGAFYDCKTLRSVTIPSTVTEMGGSLFIGSNLSEVIFLGDNRFRLLNQDFFNCGFWRDEQGLLNEETIKTMLFDAVDENAVFQGCFFDHIQNIYLVGNIRAHGTTTPRMYVVCRGENS